MINEGDGFAALVVMGWYVLVLCSLIHIGNALYAIAEKLP